MNDVMLLHWEQAVEMADLGLFRTVRIQEVQPGRKVGPGGEVREAEAQGDSPVGVLRTWSWGGGADKSREA